MTTNPCKFLQPYKAGGRTVTVCTFIDPKTKPHWLAMEHCFHQIWNPGLCNPSICAAYKASQ